MRLDLYLTENRFSESRSKAQKLIESGRVLVDGTVTKKASQDILDNNKVSILPSNETEFVGRGGLKLEHAFKTFNISAKDKTCLDIGASTGGFTQCLLYQGAAKVYAVDSGKGQLSKQLSENEHVISIEGFNARNLTIDVLDEKYMDVVVMDVSFISQKLLYPAILRVSKKGADIITLIKPQFEAGRQNVGKKGIVKDEKIRMKVVNDIIEFAEEMGFEYIDHTESPILGGDGNKEFLLHLKVKL